MQKQPAAAHESDTQTRRTQDLRDRPSHPAFDRLEEMEVKELQEDHDTLKKGFNRLLEMHIESAGKIMTLEKDFDQCRELKVQLEARVEHLEAQIIVANKANSMLRKVFNEVSEKLKCMICLGLFAIPYRYGLLPPSTSFTFNQPVVLASTAATCIAGPAWSNGSLPREPQPALRVASTASTYLNQ
ncbi:hypothetical protein BJ322DRAFT_1104431 [Thelephora terrestris]|uniref:Uncharacterized protein n=1 Tax=Thelephora terrestris TaxID=56493 RepID=A0A9P6HMH8_9AGAM|nr:hypothetical protein BJ322DRAFT_1104431 [Thelephora terrestris]